MTVEEFANKVKERLIIWCPCCRSKVIELLKNTIPIQEAFTCPKCNTVFLNLQWNPNEK